MDAGRRKFLKIVSVAAPAVILTPGLLMKIKPRPLWMPTMTIRNEGVIMGGGGGGRVLGGSLSLDFSGMGLTQLRPGDIVRVKQSHFGPPSFDAIVTSSHCESSCGLVTYNVRAQQVEPTKAAPDAHLDLSRPRESMVRDYQLTVQNSISIDFDYQAAGSFRMPLEWSEQ